MRPPFKKRSKPIPSLASKSLSQKQLSRIEKIAYELYQTRQLLNRPGDHTTDWGIAERIVQSRLHLALYRCHRPFIRLEKNTWEPLLAWANNQALLSLLGLIGNVGLIIAVVTYVGSEKQRRDAEVLNAWQTITSAHGQAGSGGRIEALEFLNASPGANWRRKFPWICAPLSPCLWNAQKLDGIDLSVELPGNVTSSDQINSLKPSQYHELDQSVYLREIKLPKADLRDANLQGANLESSDLQEAVLRDANLEDVSLWLANLREADLWLANLENANLRNTNLEKAELDAANLTNADLRDANLAWARMAYTNLAWADLRSANLRKAQLRFANLRGANLTGANLRDTNLEGVENLTIEQLSQAKLCRTRLPTYINVPPERDCEELSILLKSY